MVDNGAYGSTGDQPTHTSGKTDLAAMARGAGACSTKPWPPYHRDPGGARQSPFETDPSVTGLHSRPVYEGTQGAIATRGGGESIGVLVKRRRRTNLY
jgi:hypothetical protein